MRMNPDGTKMERLVHGLRVPYSFEMDPFGQLWLLSNGEGNRTIEKWIETDDQFAWIKITFNHGHQVFARFSCLNAPAQHMKTRKTRPPSPTGNV